MSSTPFKSCPFPSSPDRTLQKEMIWAFHSLHRAISPCLPFPSITSHIRTHEGQAFSAGICTIQSDKSKLFSSREKGF